MIISIDCGLTGGIFRLKDDGSVIDYYRMPVISIKKNGKDKKELDIKAARDLIKDADVVVMEKVWAYRGQGVSSIWTFGQMYGSLLGIIETLDKPLCLVTPQKWKTSYDFIVKGDTKKNQKKAAISQVRELLGDKKLTEGQAESYLIGMHYIKTKVELKGLNDD